MKHTASIIALLLFAVTATAQISISQRWETVATVEGGKRYVKDRLMLKIAISAENDTSYFLEKYANWNYPQGPSYTTKIALGNYEQMRLLLQSIVNYNGPSDTEVELNNPTNDKGYFYNNNAAMYINKGDDKIIGQKAININMLRELLSKIGL